MKLVEAGDDSCRVRTVSGAALKRCGAEAEMEMRCREEKFENQAISREGN